MMICYVNGKWVDKHKAKVSVMDLGLQRGWAVFEYLRTYKGAPFQLEGHLKRYFNSCQQLYLESPLKEVALSRLITRITKINFKNRELGIKVILTAGSSRDGVTPSTKPNLMILVSPVKKYSRRFYQQGLRLMVSRRDRCLTGIKTVNYLSSMQALVEAKRSGFDDALFCTRKGEVLEATRSNFFYFKGGTLYTAANQVLPGITRGLTIKLATGNFTVIEKVIKFADLTNAEEAFISSSDKEIMPVIQVGNLKIGNGRVGEKTKFLMSQFKRFVNSSDSK